MKVTSVAATKVLAAVTVVIFSAVACSAATEATTPEQSNAREATPKEAKTTVVERVTISGPLITLVHPEPGTPDIEDINIKDVSIVLRFGIGPCLGTCSVYSLSISGYGTVNYHGYDNVAVLGQRTEQISQEKVWQIVKAFYRVGFFSLVEACREMELSDGSTECVTIEKEDAPYTHIAFKVGDYEKSFEIQGLWFQWELSLLVDYIGEVVNSGRWIAGSAEAPCPNAKPTPSVPATLHGELSPTAARLGETWLRSADGMVMVYVPAGDFEMGIAEGDGRGSDWERPKHRVTLDGFWLDRTEVTNAQYRGCVEAGSCKEPFLCTYDFPCKTDHPVVCVDWHGAQAYCEWAGVRLPSEAEWEYAARGTEGLEYPWGNDFDCSLGNFGIECDAFWKTAPAGSFPDGASWCGALDLAGNAAEWVSDWLGDYSAEEQTNPTGPATGDAKVIRGGSFYDILESHLLSSSRSSSAPDYSHGVYVGFRCAASSTSRP